MQLPRIVISGLSGGSGKTLLSLGLTRAFRQRGRRVQPAKKGPDYIDAAWLGIAAGRPAANLDPYFLSLSDLPSALVRSASSPFFRDLSPDLAVIEGNRGLYDGRDLMGTCSTAQVALALGAPVVLAVNCTKMTRTTAAIVAGIASFVPELSFAGVVLNNVGNPRHAAQVRQAVEYYTDIPVLGALPRLRENPLPERHMGLELSPASREPRVQRNGKKFWTGLPPSLRSILILTEYWKPLPLQLRFPILCLSFPAEIWGRDPSSALCGTMRCGFIMRKISLRCEKPVRNLWN